LELSEHFRQEFEFNLENIDVFTSEASRCEGEENAIAFE
jgi:hypothetical protein